MQFFEAWTQCLNVTQNMSLSSMGKRYHRGYTSVWGEKKIQGGIILPMEDVTFFHFRGNYHVEWMFDTKKQPLQPLTASKQPQNSLKTASKVLFAKLRPWQHFSYRGNVWYLKTVSTASKQPQTASKQPQSFSCPARINKSGRKHLFPVPLEKMYRSYYTRAGHFFLSAYRNMNSA